MFTTPARSAQRPPNPAKPIGTARPSAAEMVPRLVKSSTSAQIRTSESVANIDMAITKNLTFFDAVLRHTVNAAVIIDPPIQQQLAAVLS
ncbi:unannotated protein [freshwater metagenome]|uniref:Unannotated protein n=1 Tax=freshwater metagenome TaxID=449393 RepID=A0A6J6F8V8_9ZZZZ